MHATAMHFAIPMPDWNSLDSVRHAHSLLEAVALGFFALLVLFDVLSHFSEDKKRERWLEKIALCFFAIAVLAEIVAYPYGQRNDTLSEQIIGSLDAKAREAASNASTALTNSREAETKSSDALEKAGRAQDSLGKAEADSNAAQKVASNALGVARDARREAQSFEADIVSAKKQAAEAESHLANALERAAKAEAEIAKIRLPRRLDLGQQQRIGEVLLPFSGQKYSFFVFNDPESMQFLTDINEALKNAKWQRVDAPSGSGFGFNVAGGQASSINDVGLKVGFAPDDTDLIPVVRAIVKALNAEGAFCTPVQIDELKGKGHHTVFVSVGQKPL
jgi:hypothetical protein